MIRVIFRLVPIGNGAIMLRGRPSDRPQGWTNILKFRTNGVISRCMGVSRSLGLKLDNDGRIMLNG